MEAQTKTLNLSDLYRSQIKSIIVNFVESEDWEKVLDGIELIKTIDAKFKPSATHNVLDTIPKFDKNNDKSVTIKSFGKFCHDHAFRQKWILNALALKGEEVYNTEILAQYEEEFGHLFTDYDLEVLPKEKNHYKDIHRWEHNMCNQYSRLKAKGKCGSSTNKYWGLTPKLAIQ